MKLLIAEIGSLALYGGVITEVREGTGNAKDRVINIKLKGMEYNRTTKKEVEKTVEISLWNSRDGSCMLADRARKANVSVGKFITVLAKKSESGNLYALNFKYSGRYTFRENGEHGEINVFIGPIGNVIEKKNYVLTSVPVKEQKGDTWYPIVFFNDEADELSGKKENKLADAAKRCFVERNGKRPKVVIVTAPNKTYKDRNGEERSSYKAYSFDMQPDEAYKTQ